jgi:hypothetical protein
MPHAPDLAGDLDLVTTEFAHVRLIGYREAAGAKAETLTAPSPFLFAH